MIEFGTVINKEKGLAKIELDRSSACIKCGLCSTNTEKKNYLFFPDKTDLKPGDKVKIEISQKVILQSSLITFLIPITGIILGIILSLILKNYININPDIMMAVLVFACVGLSFPVVKFFDNKSNIEKDIKIEKLEL